MSEIAQELAGPEITEALVESKRQFELGKIGTDEDIEKLLRNDKQ